jgi:HNH endonuclease
VPWAPRSEPKPLAPERYGLQVTLDRETYELLQHVRALMSHEVPTGETVLVLKGALKLAAGALEKRKYAATDRPGRSRGCSSARRIPAAVRRAVRERDGGQCAFVSDSGKRCTERTMLEYDHKDPIARRGVTTVENLRLLCRAHNQHEADRAFGAEFMERKRREAQERTRG